MLITSITGRSTVSSGCLRRPRRSQLSLENSDRLESMSQQWRSCAGSVEQAILDIDGRYHGLRARIVRAFQRLGYDETTLEIYDEALAKGDMLLEVPVRPTERRRIVALLQRHDVHDVGYFGSGTFEQFPIIDAS